MLESLNTAHPLRVCCQSARWVASWWGSPVWGSVEHCPESRASPDWANLSGAFGNRPLSPTHTQTHPENPPWFTRQIQSANSN